MTTLHRRYGGLLGILFGAIASFSACESGEDASPGAQGGSGGDADASAAGKGGNSTAGQAGSGGAATAGSGGSSAGSAGSGGLAGSAGNGAGGSDAGTGGAATGGASGEAGAAGSAGSQGGNAGTAGTGGAAGAAGSDAGGSGAAGAAGSSGVAVCGLSPYQHYELNATILNNTPATAVSVTGNICSGTTVEIPFGGTVGLDVQRNTPFFLIGTQTGNLTAFGIESKVTLDLFPTLGYGFFMAPPTYPAVLNPSWDPASMALFGVSIGSIKAGATAPCNDKAGITFSVPNHPEAFIKYAGGGTSTVSGGDAGAWVTLVTTGTIDAPEFVTVTATKAGCVVGLEAGTALFVTGRLPVAVNVATATIAYEISN